MIKIYCNNCCSGTNHNILKEEIQNLTSEDGDFWVRLTLSIIQCAWCDTVSFMESSLCSEDIWIYFDEEVGQEVMIDTPKLSFFPPRQKDKLKINNELFLPDEIGKVYNEVIRAFNEKLTILCAIGIRAIMDWVCANLWIKDGPNSTNKTTGRSSDLYWKIAWLAEKGIITGTQASMLQQLRVIWNESAHQLEIPSSKELEIAIRIIETSIFELIYRLPDDISKIVGIRKRSWKKVHLT